MKNLRECECDDREMSKSVRRHKNRDAQISSSFASAASIPKEVLGFAKWHLDSHFWSIFGSFCPRAIPPPENRILIQDKNRAAAAG
ncbi:MAG TPA: hypothetical protein VFP11_16155 [Candidatus Angelobacter sp.]|nr:hypothetical protein [Candidatus Angelobacter sp.]